MELIHLSSRLPARMQVRIVLKVQISSVKISVLKILELHVLKAQFCSLAKISVLGFRNLPSKPIRVCLAC